MLVPFSLQAEHYGLSSSCGSFSHSTVDSNWYAVTNLSQSLKVSGNRSVWVVCIPDGTGQSYFEPYNGSGAEIKVNFRIKRDSTVIHTGFVWLKSPLAMTLMGMRIPPQMIEAYDIDPASGTYTYSVETMLDVANNVATFSLMKLLVMEVLF